MSGLDEFMYAEIVQIYEFYAVLLAIYRLWSANKQNESSKSSISDKFPMGLSFFETRAPALVLKTFELTDSVVVTNYK